MKTNALIGLLFLMVIIFIVLNRKKIETKIVNPAKQKILSKIMDLYTQKKIMELHPAIREKAIKHIELAEQAGISLRITDALRTFERQQELYNIGRDEKGNIIAPGKIVTKARPGTSMHQYALAYDVVPVENGKLNWNSKMWNIIGSLGERVGLEWGGRWKFIDKPHFQISGYSVKNLLAKHHAKKYDNEGFINLT